ncbi:MAG: VWA domain-containing protein, partial [Thermoleophilia bacterium]|nr:VWA domain-containing protein [Thermoleophilia bacterium]
LRGRTVPPCWAEGPDGSPVVSLRLGLNPLIEALGDERRTRAHTMAFKSAFLHELGHIMHTPYRRRGQAREEALAPTHPRRRELDGSLVALAERPDTADLLDRMIDYLEDARVERLLLEEFRGAPQFLGEHVRRARDRLASPGADEVERTLAYLFLGIRGGPADFPAAVSPWVVRTGSDLLARLPDPPEAADVAESVVYDLFPRIAVRLPRAGAAREYPSAGQRARVGRPSPGTTLPSEEGERPLREPILPDRPSDLLDDLVVPTGLGLGEDDRDQSARGGGGVAPTLSGDFELIFYPHVDGSLVVDEIEVANAHRLMPTPEVTAVLRQVQEQYGPLALEAFAAETAALRRAFQVNADRRAAGHYRSGRRVGTTNLRRYLASQDLRLFQRIEMPARLSYYFHLLVDVSPSMLHFNNVAKALAVAYAMADALQRLRVPVDVTLYSSAITVLHDFRQDLLERFFGESFGYLSAGTYEIEALAYAKLQAERVSEERRLIIVITDGRPNGAGFYATGASDLKTYYQQTLIPWIRRAGIDVMAIGIEVYPDYHEDAVCITSSWEAIGVLMRLLDQMIAEGERRHAALWR